MTNKKRNCIGIDLLGASPAPSSIVQALLDRFALDSSVCFKFFGLSEHTPAAVLPPTWSFVVAKDVVQPEDDPLWAARRKPLSSMNLGILSLKEETIDAFISAGNTGALFAASVLQLPLLDRVKKPALLAHIPTKQTPVAVLDVGAGVRADSDTLLQFALMGVAYQQAQGIAVPRIGLLNIGEEKKKGTPEIQGAYEKLHTLCKNSSDALFIGNVEGKDVFTGNLDLLVTDGFTGNVFLKTAEGIAGFVVEQLDMLPQAKPFVDPIIKVLQGHLDSTENSAALLCGLDRIVLKCHGSAPPKAFVEAAATATHLIEQALIGRMKQKLSK